jgi:hypothetical protein
MKKIVLLFSLAALAACNSTEKKPGSKPAGGEPAAAAADSLLVTDSTWGLIDKTASFATLTALYGSANVKDERICGPECVDSLDVTLLYPGQRNEAIIYWADSAYHKSISFIECRGDSAGYHTAAGIKNGSGFADLLKLNGRRINFYGFGWDYGGTIISYNKGALEASGVHYDIDIKGNGGEGLYGDTELHSDMPQVKQYLNQIYVRRLTLIFK